MPRGKQSPRTLKGAGQRWLAHWSWCCGSNGAGQEALRCAQGAVTAGAARIAHGSWQSSRFLPGFEALQTKYDRQVSQLSGVYADEMNFGSQSEEGFH